VLLAITYGLLGVLLGPVLGRVSGVFIAFLIPFLDIGIGQSPMLRGEPADWATYLPGYGGTRLFIDGALTASFDETRALLIALGWLAALGTATTLLFRNTATARWWDGLVPSKPPRRTALRSRVLAGTCGLLFTNRGRPCRDVIVSLTSTAGIGVTFITTKGSPRPRGEDHATHAQRLD
jgi:hypothetical protein